MTSETIFQRRDTRPATIPEAEIRKLDALWRASNYLSVGQIYLLDNPGSSGPKW
jgi:phosphoketolase